MDNLKRASQIAIVGVGQVGAAAAYALVLGSIADELLLVDIRAAWRDGQVRDLSDAAYASRSKTRVYGATYREASQCDIVVITAGSKYLYGRSLAFPSAWSVVTVTGLAWEQANPAWTTCTAIPAL
ncbi:hypothetical protein BDW72DRAFT_189018 [Aspergillus terricola var. indicus]